MSARDESIAPATGRHPVASTACVAVLALETVGWLALWPTPHGWLWVGGRVYAATESLAAAGGVTFLGFVATAILAMKLLARVDRFWITLRRRAGHDQTQGALTQVVVVSATFGIVLFLLWYYVIGQAFVIPFMPSQ